MNETLDKWLAGAQMVRFDVKHDYFTRCYGSVDQLFIVAEFKDQADLQLRWEIVARAVATEVQAKMNDVLDDMRWDTYLLCYVDDDVDERIRTIVETDRRFFRKLVLDGDLKTTREKVPVRYEIERDADGVVNPFSDEMFLEEFLQQLDASSQNTVLSLIRTGNLPDYQWEESDSQMVEVGDDE